MTTKPIEDGNSENRIQELESKLKALEAKYRRLSKKVEKFITVEFEERLKDLRSDMEYYTDIRT